MVDDVVWGVSECVGNRRALVLEFGKTWIVTVGVLLGVNEGESERREEL